MKTETMSSRIIVTLILYGILFSTAGVRAQDLAQTQWDDIDYKGAPWVENVSKPYKVSRGLAGRHVTVWASHGRYYDNGENRWKWQRPPLFGTNEDLCT